MYRNIFIAKYTAIFCLNAHLGHFSFNDVPTNSTKASSHAARSFNLSNKETKSSIEKAVSI